MSSYSTIRKFSLALFFTGALTGCGLGGSAAPESFSQLCSVPADQSGTISGHWAKNPIPIALSNGQFSGDETTQITGAADGWNKFFNSSKSFPILDYGSGGFTQTSVNNPAANGTLCGQSIFQGNQFTGRVGVYKLSNWGSYPANAMALTVFCTRPTTGATSTSSAFPLMYVAVVLLNYQSFFIDGQKQPDLWSIVFHEFGHLMGLGHSCATSNTKGFPLCSAPSVNPNYLSAVMFPNFSFDGNGNGEVRRTLGTNDQERANCLY